MNTFEINKAVMQHRADIRELLIDYSVNWQITQSKSYTSKEIWKKL